MNPAFLDSKAVSFCSHKEHCFLALILLLFMLKFRVVDK